MASLFQWFLTRNHLFSMTGCVCIGWVASLVSFKILSLGIYTIFLAHSCAHIAELGLLEFLEYMIHVFQKIQSLFLQRSFFCPPPPFLFSFWISHDMCLWVWGCPTGPSGCLFVFALFPFVSQSVSTARLSCWAPLLNGSNRRLQLYNLDWIFFKLFSAYYYSIFVYILFQFPFTLFIVFFSSLSRCQASKFTSLTSNSMSRLP